MSELKEKKWSLKTQPEETLIEELKEALKIHPVLCSLLLQRGVDSFESAKTFFRPSLEQLHDPYEMKDMDVAVETVLKTFEEGKSIMLLGDYDVDGTTSAALMYLFFKDLSANVTYYIPDRYKEGYGVSKQSIQWAQENEIALIISLDCGIKAMNTIKTAREKGIGFIVCDHHTPGEDLPPANAVLDPKRKDCSYPYKELSGCGVGYKLAEAISKRLENKELNPEKYLDLLAVSIAADIVPLTGENRTMSHFGLKKLNSEPLPGLQALRELTPGSKEFTNADVVFKIAPRINSAGRMASGSQAVEILSSNDKKLASEKLEIINELNNERRELDQEITKEALSMIQSDESYEGKVSTVLFNENWHKGVIGIVASRVIEHHYRPTIILTGNNGVISGSARSVKGFDIYEALESCNEYLVQFGGHKYAAGMTLESENLEAFKAAFDDAVKSRIQDEQKTFVLEADAELDLADINSSFYQILRQFAPFGPKNMNPLFISHDVVVNQFRKLIDKNGNAHLKMTVSPTSNPSVKLDTIGFGLGEMENEIVEGTMTSLIYHIEENHWNGRVNLQLNLKDLQIH
jgi:single-stranded-DNA-specific exonuclease